MNSLLSDGLLQVKLQNTGTTNKKPEDRSDFLFLKSTLTVHVNKAAQAQQVPEPATLALVGLGVFGFVIGRRKKI
nr:PEP-CTERM sorting domain-containing protein [Methylomarinum sp. Ch1-1]MDP4521778.1 PEP-CTERM sorting domain-containing protein [Methylomarinum sp. Ch1-1]